MTRITNFGNPYTYKEYTMTKDKVISFKCEESYVSELKRLAAAGGTTLTDAIRGCIAYGANAWLATRKAEMQKAEKNLQAITITIK
jgi:hypothetical protein